ncbi:MAG: hypothetical protein J7M32_03405, partial [Deltaproteobacteria bacterium]|nr:hypothetical protein [Deltaproteobacteria bacterium]
GNGGQACPFGILAFVELRLPPLISHKETAPSRQSRQKNPPAPFIELLLFLDVVIIKALISITKLSAQVELAVAHIDAFEHVG